MLILYDFECPTCGLVEIYSPSGKKDAPCPKCECKSRRVFAHPPRISWRAGVDPRGCPTLADKWAKAHEQAAREGDGEPHV